MSKFTPTTDQVRMVYVTEGTHLPAAKSHSFAESCDEFNRWLEQVETAAVRRALSDYAGQTEDALKEPFSRGLYHDQIARIWQFDGLYWALSSSFKRYRTSEVLNKGYEFTPIRVLKKGAESMSAAMDRAVEAAAKALRRHRIPDAQECWDDLPNSFRDFWRDEVREAVEAAAPFLRNEELWAEYDRIVREAHSE